MNLGSRLRFTSCQSSEKTADVSNLCKSTENGRRARKLEKGKMPWLSDGGTAGLCDLLINKLYTENQGNKIITDQADCEHFGKNP